MSTRTLKPVAALWAATCALANAIVAVLVNKVSPIKQIAEPVTTQNTAYVPASASAIPRILGVMFTGGFQIPALAGPVEIARFGMAEGFNADANRSPRACNRKTLATSQPSAEKAAPAISV